MLPNFDKVFEKKGCLIGAPNHYVVDNQLSEIFYLELILCIFCQCQPVIKNNTRNNITLRYFKLYEKKHKETRFLQEHYH